MKKTLILILSLSIFHIKAQEDTVHIHGFGDIKTSKKVINKIEVLTNLSSTGIDNIPSSYRMDNECPPVINQGNFGSCVSHATAYGLCSILAKRKYGWDYTLSSGNLNTDHVFSPLFCSFAYQRQSM